MVKSIKSPTSMSDDYVEYQKMYAEVAERGKTNFLFVGGRFVKSEKLVPIFFFEDINFAFKLN